MPLRWSPRCAALAVVCATTLTCATPGALAAGGEEAAPPPSTTVDTPPDTPTTTLPENVFLPENRDLDDCISSLPKPDCGSKSRGGWRQLTVFGVMLGGMAAIGARIAYSVRKRERARRASTAA